MCLTTLWRWRLKGSLRLPFSSGTQAKTSISNPEKDRLLCSFSSLRGSKTKNVTFAMLLIFLRQSKFQVENIKD